MKHKKPALSWPFWSRQGEIGAEISRDPIQPKSLLRMRTGSFAAEQLSERKGYPALSVKCCFVSFLKTSKQKHSWR